MKEYTIIKQAVLNSLHDRYEVMVLYRDQDGKMLKIKKYTVKSASMGRFYKLSNRWQCTTKFTKRMTPKQYRDYMRERYV